MEYYAEMEATVLLVNVILEHLLPDFQLRGASGNFAKHSRQTLVYMNVIKPEILLAEIIIQLLLTL